MSNQNEMRIDPPAGWRWVEVGEECGGAEWRYISYGKWVISSVSAGKAVCAETYITPITPAEPETVDVPVKTVDGNLRVYDPNDNLPDTLGYAPNITGPTWAFAGYVWPDSVSCEDYFLCVGDTVKYCNAVRFRRVKGGAK